MSILYWIQNNPAHNGTINDSILEKNQNGCGEQQFVASAAASLNPQSPQINSNHPNSLVSPYYDITPTVFQLARVRHAFS